MLRKFKKIRFFPAIVLSFSLLGLSPYLHAAHWAESDFTSADVGFENPNQESTPFDHLSGLRIFEANSLPGVLSQMNDIDEGILLSLSQRSFFAPKILPLRR